jgi:hypothetical protein
VLHRIVVPVLAGMLLAACDKEPEGPASQGVAGTYTYTFADITNGNGVVCAGSATMPLVQRGASFSGTHRTSITCSSAFGSTGGNFEGIVVNGRVSGDSVFFDLDDQRWHNSGVLEGSAMRGIVTINAQANGEEVRLSGTFRAERH